MKRMDVRAYSIKGLLVLSLLVLAGCAQWQQKAEIENISQRTLRPFFNAIKENQWDAARSYLAEDVELISQERFIPGKTPVIEYLKSSPARRFETTMTLDSIVVTADRAEVHLDIVGKRAVDGNTAWIHISLKMTLNREHGEWLIKTLIHKSLDLF